MRSYTCLCMLMVVGMLPVSMAKLPLDDAVAVVDHLFTYSLDPSDFQSANDIKVVEMSKEMLPNWLHYDEQKHELSGIPAAKDKGTYILSANQEVFAVTVSDVTTNQVAEPVMSDDKTICKPHESITVVYIKLNTDTDSYKAHEKTRLVRSISSQLSLKPGLIALKAEPRELVETSSALVSGPGDAASTTDKLPSTLSWIVGCGAVKSHHMDILEELEVLAKSGDLGRLLRVPVGGWQVQSEQAKFSRNRRLRRNVKSTATPGVTSVEVTTTAGPKTETTTQKQSTTKPSASADKSTQSTTTASTTTASTTSSTSTTTTAKSVVPRKLTVNTEVIPASQKAFAKQLFQWEVPDNLFTNPDDGILTLNLEDPQTGNALRRLEPWFVYKTADGLGWTVVGLPPSPSMKHMVLRASNERGDTATVTLMVDVQAEESQYLTEIYSVSIRTVRALKAAARDAYLALTLSQYLGVDNLLLNNVRMDSDLIQVEFGANRGMMVNCPEDLNREVEAKLRSLATSPVRLMGREAADNLNVISLNKLVAVLPCTDSKPELNVDRAKEIEEITVRRGVLYERSLPTDLFRDREDGDMSKLNVELLAEGVGGCMSWMCLDKMGQTLQAFVWDTKTAAQQFELVVSDSAKHEQSIAITATVTSTYVEPTHSFTLTINEAFSQFANSLKRQVMLYKALNASYPSSTIVLESVKDGSLIVQYQVYNDMTESIPKNKCPTNEINQFKAAVFEDGNIKDAFIKNLGQFSLRRAEFAPLGPCEGQIDPVSAQIENPEKEPAAGNDGGSLGIIIAVVVVVIVLIVIVVVVIVVIKRRKSKRGPQRQTVTIEKGVPTRMDEEMKDVDSKPERQPLMADNQQVHYKHGNKPPAYPNAERRDGYQPPTPPVSEPDEHRESDRTL